MDSSFDRPLRSLAGDGIGGGAAMAIWDKIKGEFIDIVEWTDDTTPHSRSVHQPSSSGPR